MDNLTPWLRSFEHLLPKTAGIRRAGAAALDLAYVAAGRLDGFWEFGLKPWDIAAGALLIREAGGLIAEFSGGQDFIATGNVVAGNPLILEELRKIVHRTTAG
jgi:myo-inositol-1(or 4)-monophosphatase